MEENPLPVEDNILFSERRQQGIGGSDAPIICGLTSWKSPMQLWAEKTGMVPPSSDGLPTEWLDLGNFIEPFILQKYEERTGRKVIRQGRFRKHPTINFLQCHLDGKVVDTQLGEGVWEAKFINPFQAGEWNEQDEKLPEKYRCQVMHNMAVTGYKYASIAALIFGKGLVIIDIDRDENYIQELIATESEFWNCVQTNQPPAAIGKDTKFLEQVYKANPFVPVVQLSDDIIQIDNELLHIKEIIKYATERKDNLEASIKQALGSSIQGVLPDGTAYIWSEQTRSSHTVQGGTYRILRRKAAPKPRVKMPNQQTP